MNLMRTLLRGVVVCAIPDGIQNVPFPYTRTRTQLTLIGFKFSLCNECLVLCALPKARDQFLYENIKRTCVCVSGFVFYTHSHTLTQGIYRGKGAEEVFAGILTPL